MSLLRLIYLGLAIWGAVHPMVYLVPWIIDNGLNLTTLMQAWQSNLAATGLFWDLVIAAVSLTVFILAEVAIRHNWIALLAIPATFLIGLSCGLPLYLFLRTRPVV